MISTKNRIIALVSILIILIAISVYFMVRKNADTLEIKKSESKLDAAQQVLLEYTKLNNVKSIEECRKKSPDNVMICISKVVGKFTSKEQCNGLTDSDALKICKDKFFLEEIATSTDPTVCYGMEKELQGSCFDSIFTRLTDKSQCDNLKDAEKKRCYELLDYLAALNNKDEKICTTISDKVLSSDCQQTIKAMPSDSDKDGIPDNSEMSLGLDAFNKDSDGDGLADGDEMKQRTNPRSKDSDEDGLTDGEEVTIYFTDPMNKDTDGDGYRDGPEALDKFNPCGSGFLPPLEKRKEICQQFRK